MHANSNQMSSTGCVHNAQQYTRQPGGATFIWYNYSTLSISLNRILFSQANEVQFSETYCLYSTNVLFIQYLIMIVTHLDQTFARLNLLLITKCCFNQ